MSQLQLPTVRRKVLGDRLADRLAALPGPSPVTIYRGEVSAAGRWPWVDGSVDPPVALNAAGQPDPSGRVGPYVVLFDAAGVPDIEPDLAGLNQDLRWMPQITVAAGFSPDCVQTIDRVYAWVYRWSPAIPGLSAGRLEPPPGYDPGQVRPDRTVSPIRFFLPMQWQLDITA